MRYPRYYEETGWVELPNGERFKIPPGEREKYLDYLAEDWGSVEIEGERYG